MHRFMDTSRRYKTFESETKDSLLLIAVAVARISKLVPSPKSRIPQVRQISVSNTCMCVAEEEP